MYLQPNIKRPAGLRDRAILEVIYSSGLRKKEVQNLKLEHVRENDGVVFIEQSKGHRDRYVPIGERALAWLNRYLREVRVQWIKQPDHGYLFVSKYGNPISSSQVGRAVREYFGKAGIQGKAGLHVIRHSIASELLRNGVDLRVIGEFLGHQCLSSTTIYTHISIDDLRKQHKTFHPADDYNLDSDSDT